MEKSIPHRNFGRVFKEFSESCATFVHVIEQLMVQVCAVEAHARKDGPSESKVLNRIAQQVNMPKLNDYLHGLHERPPQPKFLTAMTEKVEILTTLTQEMRALVDQATAMYDSLVQSLPLNAAVIANDRSEANTAETVIQDDAYIIAGTLDAMEREIELFEIAAASINVLSTSEELSSYSTLLRTEPFIMPAIKAIVLGWAAESRPDHQEER